MPKPIDYVKKFEEEEERIKEDERRAKEDLERKLREGNKAKVVWEILWRNKTRTNPIFHCLNLKVFVLEVEGFS